MAGEEFQPALDVLDEVQAAIEEFAAPSEELGWPGSAEVAQHAEEIAAFLWERGLLKAEVRS